MSAEKRSVSAPAELFARADLRAHKLGYTKFSDYIQHLLRADVISNSAHVRVAEPSSDAAVLREETDQLVLSGVGGPPLSSPIPHPPATPKAGHGHAAGLYAKPRPRGGKSRAPGHKGAKP